jgi:hypothetical protein
MHWLLCLDSIDASAGTKGTTLIEIYTGMCNIYAPSKPWPSSCLVSIVAGEGAILSSERTGGRAHRGQTARHTLNPGEAGLIGHVDQSSVNVVLCGPHISPPYSSQRIQPVPAVPVAGSIM